jgi:hypothetical protein
MAKFINIDDIEEGMSLAEPIVNNFGQILLPSGVTIRESHKKLLRTWNVRVVAIKIEGDDSANNFSEELKAKAREKVLKRLQWTAKSNFESDLLNVAVIQACKIMSKNKG